MQAYIICFIKEEKTQKQDSLSDRLFQFAVENKVGMNEIKVAADTVIQKSVIIKAVSQYGMMNYDRAAEHIMDMISSLMLKYRHISPSAGVIIDGFITSLKKWENNHGLSGEELEQVILAMDSDSVKVYCPDEKEKIFDFTFALSTAYMYHRRNFFRYGGVR